MIETPTFALTDENEVRRLVRSHGWARLISHTSEGLVASHLPVLLSASQEFEVLAHLGRPDDRIHELGTQEVLLIVEGPHGYISPGWYGQGPAVPTWNYVAAHLYGTPVLVDAQESYRILSDTVDAYELIRDEPIRLPQVAEYAERIAHGAVSFRLPISRWKAKAKLSQNRPAEVADRVIAALESDPHYANPALAQRMAEERGVTR